MIPIPKYYTAKRTLGVENFRGITLSPIISKVFEHCLLLVYKDYLHTSDRQFGFKKNISCTQAIYTVRHVIDHFVTNGSTVNICCLDICKAFDKVNHYSLFSKLIDRNVPMCLITILKNWYEKSYCQVKWGSVLSEPFALLAGVRQGGVLSPILFSVYVDDILLKLASYGCVISGISMSSFMYADDLILLSPSLSELQHMVNVCELEFAGLDLVVNRTKSECLRVGPRRHKGCCEIMTRNGPIEWVPEITYLGVTIATGSKFRISLDRCKTKFYSSFNAIYSKLGKINNAIVTLNLVSSIALPCLLYAIEAFNYNSTMFKALEHPWSRIFMKIFSTFDVTVVLQCQYFTGFLPVEHVARIRKIKLLRNMSISNNSVLRAIFLKTFDHELTPIANFYNIDHKCLISMSDTSVKELVKSKCFQSF